MTQFLINRSRSLLSRLHRRGSVLILVVALLVLMALIGTAYISVTRIDRYAIKQTNNASQVGLLLDGMSETVVNAITNDLFNGSEYRGLTLDPVFPSTYDNWDYPGAQMPSLFMGGSEAPNLNKAQYPRNLVDLQAHDSWLSARFPRLMMEESSIAPKVGTTNPPVWTAISYPPLENLPRDKAPTLQQRGYTWQFDAPDDLTPGTPAFKLTMRKLWFEPTFKEVPAGSGNYVPALRARDPMGLVGSAVGTPVRDDLSAVSANSPDSVFWAADADGDGIPDSGLFFLQEINGVKYYGAVRVIDNNSAVNVNTAGGGVDINYKGERIQWDVPPNPTPPFPQFLNGVKVQVEAPAYYFGNSVNLGSLLYSWEPDFPGVNFQQTTWAVLPPYFQGDEMDLVTRYRLGGDFYPAGLDTQGDTNNDYFPFKPALDDTPTTPTQRWDWRFITLGDAFESQLNRRLDNPGWNDVRRNALFPTLNPEHYHAFNVDDQRALAWHGGVLLNPDVNRSPLEDLFFNSNYNPNKSDTIYRQAWNYQTKVKQFPLTQQGIETWFNWNFDFTQEPTYFRTTAPPTQVTSKGVGSYIRPKRTMLVTRNPLSNQMPRREMFALWDHDEGITGNGTNWQVVGPRILYTSMHIFGYTDAAGAKSIPYYYYYDLLTANTTNNRVDIPWAEQMPFWSDQLQGERHVAPKASANTANFGELWRAYWMVMSEGDGTRTPFDNYIAATGEQAVKTPLNTAQGWWGGKSNGGKRGEIATLNDPYIGQKFWPESPDALLTPNYVNTARFPAPTGSGVLKSPAFYAEGDSYAYRGELLPNYFPQNAAGASKWLPNVYPEGWNPARMFRSPIRAMPYAPIALGAAPAPPIAAANVLSVNAAPPPALSPPPFDELTPRLMPLQTLLLRAAIAAVNTEDLRDSEFDKNKTYVDGSGNRLFYYDGNLPDLDQNPPAQPRPRWGHGTGDVSAHRIVLNMHCRDPETGDVNGIPHPVDVVVYGHEKQPYITEVFACNETVPGNPYGYVAIELYNPYDEDIELTNWKLVALDRRRTPDPASAAAGVRYGMTMAQLTPDPATAQLSSAQLIADFDPDRQAAAPQVYPTPLVNRTSVTGEAVHKPLIVPARGYLLLENHADPITGGPAPGIAPKRSITSGLPEDTAILDANAGTDRSVKTDPLNNNAIITNNKRAAKKLPQLNVAYVPGLSGMIDTQWTAGAGPDLHPGIRSVFNRELVLMRPRRADGTYSYGFYPPTFDPTTGQKSSEPLCFDEEFNPSDLVPVDSFDFTGLLLNSGAENAFQSATALATVWHYVRQNADAVQTDASGNPVVDVTMDPGKWKFVYPGRYDACPGTGNHPGTAAVATSDYPGTGAIVWGAYHRRSRQQGVETAPSDPGGTAIDPSWLPSVPVTLGGDPGTGVTYGTASNDNQTASYPTRFPIPLQMWSANSVLDTWDSFRSDNQNPNRNIPSNWGYAKFPFGGFAKNGDLLQVPFIGAYRISWQSRERPAPLTPDNGWDRYPSGIGSPTNIAAETPPGQVTGTPPVPAPNRIIELNSITMDSVFAEDTDLDDDPRLDLYDGSQPTEDKYTGNLDRTFMKDANDVQKWRSDHLWKAHDPAPTNANQQTPPSMPMQWREQVGRFCPLYTLWRSIDANNKPDGSTDSYDMPVTDYLTGDADASGRVWGYNATLQRMAINGNILINDYGSDPSYRSEDPDARTAPPTLPIPNGADWEPYWRYRFATRLFDHLNVQAPHDDTLPNYPAHQLFDPTRDYTAGSIVQYRVPLNQVTNAQNVKPRQADLWICKEYQPRLQLGNVSTQFDIRKWEMVTIGQEIPNRLTDRPLAGRQPVSNGGTTPGQGDHPDLLAEEYDQPLQGLININTADWKVLATLPLIVNPRTGVPDAGVVPQYSYVTGTGVGLPVTYRDLNEELAKAIVYFRDIDGQPDSEQHNPAPQGMQPIRMPHGPFKNLFELNQVVDLRPTSKWETGSNPNPFFGKTFADALGTLDMRYRNMDPRATADTFNTNSGADVFMHVFDPDGGVTDLSPGKFLTWQDRYDHFNAALPLSGTAMETWAAWRNDQDRYDGVRGDFEEQFLQLARISNLITTRSDSFTCYVLIQGYRDANTANPKLEVQKRVAYIIDRSRMPYKPVEKILVPND